MSLKFTMKTNTLLDVHQFNRQENSLTKIDILNKYNILTYH